MNTSTHRDFLLSATVAVLSFLAVFGLRHQGLDLLNGGQWLLSAWVLQRGGHLYHEIFTRQGPLDAHVLRVFFTFFGTRAASLAFLQAVFDGLAAAAVFLGARRLGARRWAWLAPLGVLALGPFPPRFILALWAAVILSLAGRQTETRTGMFWSTVAGLLAGASALGGMDSLALVVLLAIFTPRRGAAWVFRAAVAIPLLIALLLAGAHGTLPAAAVQVAGGAGARLSDQFERVPPTRLLHTLWSAENAPSPFSLLKTGETLSPILPAAAKLRAWSWRLRLLLLAAVVAWAWRRRQRWGPSILPLLVVATAPWVGILLRGDALFCDQAWLGALVFVPLLLGSVEFARQAPASGPSLPPAHSEDDTSPTGDPATPPPRPWPGAFRTALVLALVLAATGPSLLEAGWLATHSHRPSLHWWNRSTAGIALSKKTVHSFEALFAQLPLHSASPAANSGRADAGGPAPGAAEEPRAAGSSGAAAVAESPPEAILAWPASPGLNFLMGAPPALAQTLLLPERIRHPRRVLPQLKTAAPRLVLLGLSWDFTGRQIEKLAPGCWDELREHYRVLGNLSQAGVKLRILQRLNKGTSADELPLPSRLPDVEQTVANGESPALRHDFEVGQSFRVGPRDLQGFAVRWRTKQHDITVPLRIRIWMQQGERWNNLAEVFEIDAKIPGDLHRSYFRFPPVADSAERMVAITFEARDELDYDLRLLWHRHGVSDAPIDFYPEGTAMIDMEPVNADLYFLSW